MTAELSEVARIVVGALGGAAVGFERQWSGHAQGPAAHFAGIRTFTLLGAFGAMAGWIWAAGGELLAALLVGGAGALVVSAYIAASRASVEGTTEVAALVVVAAGVFAGSGRLALASGIFAATTLLLVEKSRLHGMVGRLDDASFRAGVRFAVMAVVILPLLPPGPYGPLGGVRPRELWALVLFFTGLSFVGYVARRLLGAQYGYVVTGFLGGVVSSTGVTFTFARTSREQPAIGGPLASGVLAACTVMFLRVLVAVAVLGPALLLPLLRYVAAPMLVGAAGSLVGLWQRGERAREILTPANPLQFWSALQLTALFQVVLFGVYVANEAWGRAGVLASGAVLGLTNADALTLSMANAAETGTSVELAALAVAIGTITNTLLKATLALFVGHAPFRLHATAGLLAIAVAGLAAIVLLR